MENSGNLTVYEKLIIPKGVDYRIFWITVGLVLFLQQEIVVRLSGETQLLPLRILISFYVSIISIVVIDLGNRFQSVSMKIVQVIQIPGNDIEEWIRDNFIEYGTFIRTPVRILAIIISGGILFTVVYLGVPYNSPFAKLNFLISLLPFTIVSSQVIYGGVGIIRILGKIVSYPLKRIFFIAKHPSIIDSSRLYCGNLCAINCVLANKRGLAKPIWICPRIIGLVDFGIIHAFCNVHMVSITDSFSHAEYKTRKC